MATANWFNYDFYMNAKLAQMVANDPTSGWTIAKLVQTFAAAGFVGPEGGQAHFEAFGQNEGLSPNSFFSPQEYFYAKAAEFYKKAPSAVTELEAANMELAIKQAGMNAWSHYTAFGSAEGVNPSNNFDSNNYMEAKLAAMKTADPEGAWDMPKLVKAFQDAGLSALEHFMMFGGSGTPGEVAQKYDPANPSIPVEFAVPESEKVNVGSGEKFPLTIDIDNLTGTSSNDTFIATNTTLNNGDTINGGAGTDTLTVTMGAAAQPIATLNSVENVEFAAGVATNTNAINAGNWTGVETLKLKGLGVSLADNGWAFTGLQNNVKIALDNVTVGTDGHHAINAAFASGKLGSSTATLALDLNNVGTSSSVRAGIEVATAGTDAFTKLSINASGKNFVQVEGGAPGSMALTDITVTGAGGLTLAVDGTNATITDLVTFNAGKATGAINSDLSASTKAVTYTGSAGKNTIIFGDGDNVITGGAAADTFTLGSGKNTVTGGDGNDTVIGAVAEFTKDDTIDLGAGTRDALIYNNVTTLDSNGVTAGALAALKGYSGVEVVGSSGAVTAVDFGYFTQNVARLTADLTAAVTVSNVAGDTLELTGNGITGVNGDALTISGALPNQTFTLEMNGATGATLAGTDGTAGNTGLTIASGVSTVNILSTTTASSTAGIENTIANVAASTATHSIDNVSAGSFVLTGNVDFTIGMGKTAGFTKAVDFNASAFTGNLNIAASADADVIKGGTGDDIINALGGNDVIDLTAGGKDTLVFAEAAATNGKDTISGFGAGNGGDVLDVGAAIITPNSLTTITSLTGGATVTDNAIIVVNFGGAIAGKAFGGADFGDLFGSGKVFSDTIASGIDAIIVVQGTDQTLLLMLDDGGDTTVTAGEIGVLGVLSDVTNADSFHITNFA